MKKSIWGVFFFINIFEVCLLQAYGFSAGTLVRTQHTYLPIEQCKIGDVVLTRDMDSLSACPVTYKNQFFANSYVKINVNEDCLHTSPHQQFYAINKNRWVRALELQPFDM